MHEENVKLQGSSSNHSRSKPKNWKIAVDILSWAPRLRVILMNHAVGFPLGQEVRKFIRGSGEVREEYFVKFIVYLFFLDIIVFTSEY